MKATGIVRKIDDLGRVVIPKELRRTMNIEKKDPMEIYVDEDTIILKKYEPACIFCGNAENTIDYMGKFICKDCLNEMVEVSNGKSA
ncbi:AbrB/MazE/SpoVT family DNA-binding domain-containing protein [Halothermothrix orenii]|uniref:Transcriptional regulator, AbrB family n=1 Tax=Halothermothrix orenii (strain H 168 / OCM 544 / DSM 9562) TaxID=373903 RepID=B8D2G6_HALOH|nr:AbrB/MazE/SpoVT family DNA-binding domain-containing protein [Halothermothrix orenii]ACL69393.1 transcriptional regulator, AbrB family [Halothermothrix orenii H 168]